MVKTGLEVLLDRHIHQFNGRRIGLATNHTGVDRQLNRNIDILAESPHVQLMALFSPEHGLNGESKEGEKVTSAVDAATGLPVHSLYGTTRKPAASMLEKIDVMLFDMQDIGSRYYTYIYTMANIMESCGEHGVQVVVLDRPNPISGQGACGNLVEENVRSFVGKYPIPNRHSLTIAELAICFQQEFGVECSLQVIPMEGWKRDMYYEDTGLVWVPPSPNTTSIDMCLLYAGTCLFEGTNLSEGRGTVRPFEQVGAPFIEGDELAHAFNRLGLPGVLARAVSFKPFYSKFTGEVCGGIQLHVTDRDSISPLSVSVRLLELIAHMYPKDFSFIHNRQHDSYFFDLLSGNKILKASILEGKTEAYHQQFRSCAASFRKRVQPYLLY